VHQPDDRGAVSSTTRRPPLILGPSVSVKSIAVSVNSWSIESALSPSIWP
jgi:hypothetical protein